MPLRLIRLGLLLFSFCLPEIKCSQFQQLKVSDGLLSDFLFCQFLLAFALLHRIGVGLFAVLDRFESLSESKADGVVDRIKGRLVDIAGHPVHQLVFFFDLQFVGFDKGVHIPWAKARTPEEFIGYTKRKCLWQTFRIYPFPEGRIVGYASALFFLVFFAVVVGASSFGSSSAFSILAWSALKKRLSSIASDMAEMMASKLPFSIT